MKEEVLNDQIDSLYRIIHCNNWNCSVQALLLLYTIVSAHGSFGRGVSS